MDQLNAIALPSIKTRTQAKDCEQPLKMLSPTFGDNRTRVPPVPIPNTAVKPRTADDTALFKRGKVGNRQIPSPRWLAKSCRGFFIPPPTEWELN